MPLLRFLGKSGGGGVSPGGGVAVARDVELTGSNLAEVTA